MRLRVLILFATALLALAACGGEPASPEGTKNEQPAERNATAEEELAGGEQARADGVVLRVGGTEGARFAGTCSTGGQEREIRGQVPERFTFPASGKLECQIRKQERNDDRLRVVLTHGDEACFVHQTNARGGQIKFTYQDNSFQASSTGGSGVQEESTTRFGDQRSVQSQSGGN